MTWQDVVYSLGLAAIICFSIVCIVFIICTTIIKVKEQSKNSNLCKLLKQNYKIDDGKEKTKDENGDETN